MQVFKGLAELRAAKAELDDDTAHRQDRKEDINTLEGERLTVQAVVAYQNTPLLTRLVW